MFAVISNHHKEREAKLAAEVEEAIAAQIKEKGPRANREYIAFKTQLELYSILCLEYRCVLLPLAALQPELIFAIENHILLSYVSSERTRSTMWRIFTGSAMLSVKQREHELKICLNVSDTRRTST